MHSLNQCTIDTQKGFGPSNRWCYGGFDFTLYFEETFLSIVPFILILPVLIFRLYRLHKSPIVVDGAKWHLAKQACYILYGAIQVLSLGAMSMPSTVKTSASIATVVMDLMATFALAVTSNFEHYRNPRPSSPIVIYQTITFFFNVARIRTLYATDGAHPLAKMLLVSTLIKFTILGAELKEKREMLTDPKSFPAPEATANFFNRMVFWWLNPMMLRGFSSPLQEHNLFEIQPQLVGDRELLAFADQWDKFPNKDQPNSLFKLAIKHHVRSFASVIFPRICYTGFNFSQPFLLERVLGFLTHHNYSNRPAVGNGLIFAYILVYYGYAISGAYHQHRMYRTIAKLRGSLIGVVYRKTLTMSSSALKESEAVTLMNADMERITTGLRQGQELWASLFEIALAVWLLFRQISWAALTPLGVILLCTGAAIGTSPKLAASQKTWLDRIQHRVDATASMLGSVKAVKMTGLTPHLGKRIGDLREDEINTARTFRSLLVKITTFSFASTSLSPVVALGTYIMMAKYDGYPELTLQRALTSLVLMQLILEPVAFFITALSGLITTMGCFERIRAYLNTEMKEEGAFYKPRISVRPHSRRDHHQTGQGHELSDITEEDESTPLNSPHPNRSPMGFPNEYPNEKNPNPPRYDEITLSGDDVTLASRSGSRDCIIADSASCGWDKEKTPTLMNLNFKIKEGSLTMVVGPVSSGKSTLLKAMLGETPYLKGMQRSFYSEVAYCSQSAWLVNGTIRDNIIHGSDFDPKWYNQVIQACDLEQDIVNMAYGDETVIGSKGLSLSGGQQQRVALARAVYFRRSIVIIDDVMAGLDASTEEHVFESVLGENGLLRGVDTTIIYVSNAVHRLAQADHIIALGSDGTISEQGTFDELYQQDGYVGHLAANNDRSVYKQGEQKKAIKGFKQSLVSSKEQKAIEQENAAGDFTIYSYYIQTFGWKRWVIFCLFCALYGFGTAFPNVWVKWWANYNMKHPNQKVVYYLTMYTFISVLGLAALVLACWTLIMTMVPHAGRKLHQRLLDSVLNAPMSFFAATDTGITTNRFSSDLELIDMELPVALIRTAMMFFVLTAQLLVILASAKYVGIALPFTGVIIYFLQIYYLRTSRRLRLLDIETKAFLGTQFLELISGLITIRAFQWEYQHLERFLDVVKRAQRPFYLLYCIQRWLNMILDMIVGSIAILLVIIAVKTKDTVDPSMTGLALTSLVGFSQMLKQLITNWTLLETSMGALSRVRSFTNTVETENLPGEDTVAPDHWPKFGGIEFRGVTASHKKANRPTLDDINFAIPPGTKLGLCGRSGSGKSSLIAALLRMMDLTSGQIIIDGIDIATLPRQVVRSRLIALPQDPYVLAGTVRSNVDPLGTVPDDEIIHALRTCQLTHLLEDENIGLNAQLTTDMLSHGQCQLLCLARAMVRKGSILILDEATASVDVHTDALMQDIIRSEFKDYTIIAAAHRLDTIIDFDAVLMLDAGRVSESDVPENLLRKEGSGFKELYQIQKGDVTPWDVSTLSLINDASDRISIMDPKEVKLPEFF